MVRLTALGIFCLPSVHTSKVGRRGGGHRLSLTMKETTPEQESKMTSFRGRVKNPQAILYFKFPDDVMAGFHQFNRELRQHHEITGKHIDEEL